MRFVFACLLWLPAVVALANEWSWDFQSQLPTDALQGDAQIRPMGPTSEDYVGQPANNDALALDGSGDYVRIADEAEHGSLDFVQGDPITLEAWVRLDEIGNGQNVYIVGKGRTHLGAAKDNQNYALRLRSTNGQAAISFLFRSAESDGQPSDWHRWTSKSGFSVDQLWHHVAVTYRFGEPDTIRGYIDGKQLDGVWDMGGPTARPPIVDDDELWIGSAMGGAAGSSLKGAIDQVVVAKRLASASDYVNRRVVIERPPTPPASNSLKDGVVSVSLYEAVGGHAVMPRHLPEPLVSYSQPAFAFSHLPAPYAFDGVRRDWKGPALLVAVANINLPPGEVQWMLRAGGLSRLWIDDQVVAETPKHLGNTSGHGSVEPYTESDPWLRPLHPGHRETIVSHTSRGGALTVGLESMIGGKGYRYEAGEIIVAFRIDDSQPWQILSLDRAISLTDADWHAYELEHWETIQRVNDRQRNRSAEANDAYWRDRHQRAREFIQGLKPIAIPGNADEHVVDRFIDRRLEAAGRLQDRSPLTSDAQFLRRVYLDCVGVVPSVKEIRSFEALSEDSNERRERVIDQLLQDSRWADHWTSYWMDVLGENASVLKPSLNNSGPFRWFLHDKLRDNVAIDRWVTALLRMEGSELFGGAAGFAMAADNDVPMAAKAHVATSAFLGVNMACARCHDAPFHDWTQKDLFSLAAMLNRQAIQVPATSSVPPAFFADASEAASLITLSVTTGDRVEPEWSLNQFASEPLEEDRPADWRDRFAYQITRVENRQFAKTIVNRLWRQLMGQGIVEPVDDWEGADPSHPELLDELARRLAASDFDMKAMARLILTSKAYQRQSMDLPPQRDETKRLFAAPTTRRMTAEQLVDSMHAVIGRQIDCDDLTFDPEARMKPTAQNNLGKPRRAWQMTSLSNERDRPALSLPRAAAVAECMEAFGWTGSRQEPINHRQVEPNVIQPGVLANGLLSTQLTVMADGDTLTARAASATSTERLVDELFERFLTRMPTVAERQTFAALLRSGFETRVLAVPLSPETPVREPNVSWANHLHPVATEVRLREAERLRLGPTPTRILESEWRMRMEDVIWALINTPEFLFVP